MKKTLLGILCSLAITASAERDSFDEMLCVDRISTSTIEEVGSDGNVHYVRYCNDGSTHNVLHIDAESYRALESQEAEPDAVRFCKHHNIWHVHFAGVQMHRECFVTETLEQ